MTATYSTKLNFIHKCDSSVEGLDSAGIKKCCKIVGIEYCQTTFHHVNNPNTEYVTFPGSDQNSEVQTDINNISDMPAKCVDKNFIFLANGQDSNE